MLTLAAALGFAVGVSAQAPTTAVPKALVPFQGTWVLTSINGQPGPDGSELALTFTGDKYVQTFNGEVQERGTIKVDPAKKPMTIELTILEGNDGGKTQFGVIEIAGDSMTGNLNTPGDTTKPADFAQQPGFFLFKATKKK
jgi:uncharacterized protein (TIGR03067 family)